MNFFITAPIWGGVGIWLSALESEFGWTRTQMSLAFSLGQLEGSLSGPLVGILIDKIGSRKIVLTGVILVGIGFILFSFVNNLPIFYISFAIIMLGASMGGWMPMMASLNKWFDRKRSFAMGIASSGFSLGGVILLPILAWSVTPDHVGWQMTARWIGITFIIVAWPFSQMIRNRPEDYGEIPDGRKDSDATATQQTNQSGADAGLTAREALRTKAFWYIAIGTGLSSMSIGTLTVHMVISLTDQGLTLQKASFIWATMLGVSWFAQLIGGYLGDKIQKNLAMALLSWFQAASLCVVAFATTVPMALIFAVMYGLGFGARIPLGTAIRGDFFGRRSFATIMGMSTIPMAGLTILGPTVTGWIYDTHQSYFWAFMGLAVTMAIAGVLFIKATKPNLKEHA